MIRAIRIAVEAATLAAARSSQVVELRWKGELLAEAELLSEAELRAEEPLDIVEACTASLICGRIAQFERGFAPLAGRRTGDWGRAVQCHSDTKASGPIGFRAPVHPFTPGS